MPATPSLDKEDWYKVINKKWKMRSLKTSSFQWFGGLSYRNNGIKKDREDRQINFLVPYSNGKHCTCPMLSVVFPLSFFERRKKDIVKWTYQAVETYFAAQKVSNLPYLLVLMVECLNSDVIAHQPYL